MLKWTTATERQAQELAAKEAEVRRERDRLLAETDYLLMPDVDGGTEAVLTYRQALRDVPEQAGFPDNVTWPEKP